MLTGPKSEAEVGARCHEAEAERKMWSRGQILWGRGQRCRKSYKNTVYERLHSNIKFINTKKSHPVWQSQQCTIKKLTLIKYNEDMGWYEMGCLRRVMDVTRRDHIKNVDIRANLDITEDIVERIQARRLRYFSHVVRMDQHCLPNIALNGRVEGNRVEGRHRKRWLDNVTDDCYHRGWSIVEATHLATDRQRWRTYTYCCHSVPRHRDDNKKKIRVIRHNSFRSQNVT